ncbi:hypothetical protein QJS04_geneDACA022571 [Acorus gramineus]|uniref:Uncharacterized protein n=1 Tax=Acorus gramineus TaxID=55184 RepID=A0AAV9BCC6_ACOGR|nr:hypothetical protein QJS04_geneDACA022571 [Acorus gramineus]
MYPHNPIIIIKRNQKAKRHTMRQSKFVAHGRCGDAKTVPTAYSLECTILYSS